MNTKIIFATTAIITTAIIASSLAIYNAEAQEDIEIPWPSDQPYDNFVKCLSGVQYIHDGTKYGMELYHDHAGVDDGIIGNIPSYTTNIDVYFTARIVADKIMKTEVEQCILQFRVDILAAENELKQE